MFYIKKYCPDDLTNNTTMVWGRSKGSNIFYRTIFYRCIFYSRHGGFSDCHFSLSSWIKRGSFFCEEISLNPTSYVVRGLVRQLVYTSLLLIIKLRFTCSERKICSTIKKSQNIMNMVVCKILFCFLYLY